MNCLTFKFLRTYKSVVDRKFVISRFDNFLSCEGEFDAAIFFIIYYPKLLKLLGK